MNEKREDRQKQKALEAFSAFYDVVEALRGENGCPWDRAQTHSSLKPFLIEEAYETADAVTTMENGGGDEDLVEELGDLLFQVMLHSEIGRQEDAFTFADVADGIRRKMIHRHPHVFSDAEGRTQKKDWETLKREEKAPETPQEEMERVPHCFPALLRTQKVQKKMQKYDGTGSDFHMSVRAVRELLQRAEEVGSVTDEDGGAILYEISNVLRLSGINGEQALKDTLEKRLRQRDEEKPVHCPESQEM